MLSIAIVQIGINHDLFGLKRYISKNIIENSNFKKGLKDWNYKEGVDITNLFNDVYVHIKGKDKVQTRFWQDIDVVSGKTYRLQFNLNGNNQGAFVIYRDIIKETEDYFVCDTKVNHENPYFWDIKPNRTGKNRIYFSTIQTGDFFFSNIKLFSDEIIYPRFIIIITLIVIVIMIFLSFSLRFILSDLYFVVIILIFMLLPIIIINRDIKSKNENRNLFAYKNIIVNNRLNVNFGQDFNNWLNDRFWGREIVIGKFRDLRYTINRRLENQFAIKGKDGWLFEKFNPNSFLSYSNSYSKISENIINLKLQCNNKGVNVYFASIPEKNSIYYDYNYFSPSEEKLSKMLSKSKDFKFIFLIDEFDKEKNNGLLYFKDDHHFTERGAFLYTKKLIELCKCNFPELHDLNIDDYEITKILNTYNTSISFSQFEERKNFIGSIRNLLNIENDSYNDNTYYEVFRHKTYKIPFTEFSNQKIKYSIYKNNEINNRLKIMILGDSNISFMVPFITSSFSESLFLQVNVDGNVGWYFKKYSDIFDSFKPNVIFLIVRSSNLQRWVNLSEF